MKLAYQDVAGTPGAPAVVLHREGMTSIEQAVGVARSCAGVGRVVAPYGDYAYYPSGMEAGGICWYRLLPGCAGTDPISLAKAVVQVCDLLDDLALDRPVLIGWGQGGVVALGAGLLRAARAGPVVAVDAPPGHVGLLPARALAASPRPPLLLATTGPDPAPALDGHADPVGGGGPAPVTWRCPAGGGPEERDKALAERIGSWLQTAGRRGAPT